MPWPDPIPLAALGITAPDPVDNEPAPWHQPRTGRPFAGPEYADLRAAMRRRNDGTDSPGYPIRRW